MQDNDNVIDNPAIPFPDEIAHLDEMNRMLDDALSDAQAEVERIDGEYRRMKRYMSDYRGEIDPHEMLQNQQGLRQIDGTGAFAVTVRGAIEKLKDSPYFARIDFRAGHAGKAAPFYIGRFAFSHGGALRISDWRSPVANMFYDCEVGPAGYDAPAGRFQGELTRKRQFKIKDGVMAYALESSTSIRDDVLQQELSRTSDERMKSIIATIQKEQNQIIRNEGAGTLMIQGVAGSGKTSIALHRIAFLLYRLKDRLSARNVTIISPNRVFGDYIAGVLPELGEEPMEEVSLADIAMAQLEGVVGYEPDREPLEENDAAWASRARFKSTLAFVGQMDAFIAQMPDAVFAPADYVYGRFSASAAHIRARFKAYGKHPVKRRLQLIADDLFDRFDTENIMGDDLPGRRAILKGLNGMLTIKSTPALYKAFYSAIGQPGMLARPARNTLEWGDVYPFLYLHAAYEGLRENGAVRHLVVDEMQDYTPIQYAVLNRLFRCRKTILGDFGQRINPNHLHTLDDLRQLYDGAAFVELNKSYRSTYEIISFAMRIKRTGTIDAIERHGEAPTVIRCRDRDDEMDHMVARIKAFGQSGMASLGIITRTNRDAKALYDRFPSALGAHIISPQSTRFEGGVSITSIQMAKGLEFDEVMIPFVDDRTYRTEHDRGLLYVACTRAMHRLCLLYSGERSLVLPVGES